MDGLKSGLSPDEIRVAALEPKKAAVMTPAANHHHQVIEESLLKEKTGVRASSQRRQVTRVPQLRTPSPTKTPALTRGHAGFERDA